MHDRKWLKDLFTRKPANAQGEGATTAPYLKKLSDFASKQDDRIKIQPIQTFGLRRQAVGLMRVK